ncbi:hypothetical protein Barb7_01830 [Bacteroidales bacterium Barb7]|nr:hypothetical protein Barb7_01830 [Bacteroidales bacterium Barb7]
MGAGGGAESLRRHPAEIGEIALNRKNLKEKVIWIEMHNLNLLINVQQLTYCRITYSG